MKIVYTLFIIACLLFFTFNSFAGTTGKIAGQITDAGSGDPLAGVNVFLEGTTLGGATDIDGYYFIINIPPSTYTLKVSYVGYAEHTITDVNVEIDITRNVDLAMQSEIMTADAVMVVAERELVKHDVAGSQRSVTSEQIDALPVTSVSEVVGMEAGVTSKLEIRGGDANETLFMVDGIALRDERNNAPIMNVPLSAVQAISVQTGGMGAEFSNVRSGVVNVVMKEGDPNNYEGTVTFKLSPAQPKHFGISPYDPDSYWLRPFLDPDVCWTGTKNGAWDKYTQDQYPEFGGWDQVSKNKVNEGIYLTPKAAKRLWEWQYRKQGDIKDPDYYIDAGFGGPIPFISKDLGNLRFYASFQREKEMYLFELATDALIKQSWMVKLTSDISSTMKLSLLSMYGETFATAESRSGGTDILDSPLDVADEIDRKGFTVPWRIYTNIYYAPTARYSHTVALKFQHVLSPSTFYDVSVKKIGMKYYTNHAPGRDFTPNHEIVPGFFVDEAPFGFSSGTEYSVDGSLAFGGAVSTARDFSEINNYEVKFDMVSQVDKHNQVKTGASFTYSDYDMEFGLENLFLPVANTTTIINQKPLRGTAYIEDKIEYEGFNASAGLIIDYTNPNDKWFAVDDPFDEGFYSEDYNPETDEQKYKTKNAGQGFTFSPRLGVSHPITENSKLYFNYGHYRQIPTSERLYRVQRDPKSSLDYIGDPTIPHSKTISYELGYDHSLFDDYLIHVAAYYKDVSDQEKWIRFIGMSKVNYRLITNNSYDDIRGLELDLTKIYGKWVTGNINFEYRVGTNGYFGLEKYYQNPTEHRDYVAKNVYQEKPRPRPRVKSSIDFHTPPDFGPKLVDQRVLGGWHFNLISRWTSGLWATWNPYDDPGIKYNIQWNSYHNFDLKITKIFPFDNFDIKFFIDINNLSDHKYFSRNSFVDKFDYEAYMKSLHLPASTADELGYNYISGDDNPGDYRKAGVEWVPMEWIKNTNEVSDPNSRAVYYNANTQKYMKYDPANDIWYEMDKGELNGILDDKAYIDMPNQESFTFLNPRSIFFGFTFTYHF